MLKVLSIFGTRPEAIKMAPVVRELQRYSTRVQSLVCVTAQHREMLDQVLQIFDIVPDYDLQIMRDNQTPTQVASAVLKHLEPILQRERPDWVLVQGDTTTAAAASLAAFYAGVKVGHVEAGLRTHDKRQPFPEEINRRIAGVIADLHFAPTQYARQNLLREGVTEDQIIVTGNPVIDALRWVTRQSPSLEVTTLLSQIGLGQSSTPQVIDHQPNSHQSARAEVCKQRLILVTAHRRENLGQPLRNICLALRDIAESHRHHVHILYPVHLNPNVHGPVYRLLKDIPNITLIPPLDYPSLVHLMQHATLILTDSGGIQEEAPSLGVPVLVLREVTERPEAVEAGTVRLVGTNRERIIAEVSRLLDNPQEYARMAQAVNPYGDGRASQRIAASLLGEKTEPFTPMSKQR